MKTTITDYLPEARRPRFKDFEQTEEQRELFIKRVAEAQEMFAMRVPEMHSPEQRAELMRRYKDKY